jgi:N-acetylmuramoyl-L-alanine amidase
MSDVIVAPKSEVVSKGPVRVTSIERYGEEKGARVVINLSAPTSFNVGTLAADDSAGKDARIFVDIARASSKGIAHEIDVGGAVHRVRLGAHEGGTRVVLDLAAALYRRIFYLPDPFRIVIDVSTRPATRSDAAEGPGGGRDVRRVAIDAGHGGVDAGAVGPTGLKEKDVALDIAHRIAPVLAHELKVETLLTRDTDVFVPLDERTARANAFHADLFISIHCNASENGQARGVQTFHLDQVRDPEGAASRLAARENAARKGSAEPIDPKSLDSEMNAILPGLRVGDLVTRSRHLADLVQRSALASLAQRYAGTSDQGVKSAGFFVLVGADMPAALFETSFISNPDDESRLATADYRQKMADAIVNAIRAYREGK